MSHFDKVMEFVFLWEGGYVNIPADPGGETNFGIAKRSHPDIDIKNLTEEDAKEIYRADYWDKVRCDDLPPAIALVVMDYAVNSGVYRSATCLQKVVGAYQDGGVGPQTLEAVRAKVEEIGEKEVAWEIVLERAEFLTRLVVRKRELLTFLTGWMRRTHSLAREVGVAPAVSPPA